MDVFASQSERIHDIGPFLLLPFIGNRKKVDLCRPVAAKVVKTKVQTVEALTPTKRGSFLFQLLVTKESAPITA
jgi:hypothetical protein